MTHPTCRTCRYAHKYNVHLDANVLSCFGMPPSVYNFAEEEFVNRQGWPVRIDRPACALYQPAESWPELPQQQAEEVMAIARECRRG